MFDYVSIKWNTKNSIFNYDKTEEIFVRLHKYQEFLVFSLHSVN